MVKRIHGFTLIELLLVLTIAGVLLALAVPFASAWSQGANVQRGRTLLNQGYQTAKALALRNPTGTTTAQAAGLKMLNGLLLVCEGNPTAISCTSANATWQSQVPKNTSISIAGSDDWTIAFDSRGLTSAPATYTITEGGVNETNSFH